MINANLNEKSKDKKKSFVSRLFNFASHTMKINKKAESNNQKKKIKKLGNKNGAEDEKKKSKSLLQLEIQTCTFCDYCDGEIVADFMGQNIIYHEACKKRHEQEFAIESPVEFEKPHEIFSSMHSEILGNDEVIFDSHERLGSKLSISLNNLSTNDMLLDSDATMIIRNDRERSLDVACRNSYFVDNDTGSYTFSTADLSTIKQYGISIKKVEINDKNVETVNEKIISDFVPDYNTYDRKISRSINFPSLLPDALKTMIDIFNNNDQGLFIEPKSDQVMGKIRVFINLLRPIKMLLTARPPSIFDNSPENDIYSNQNTLDRAYYNKEVIFWLPRGTTKLLYININCPTSDVISLLLSKFNIQNNPKKFALYEHSIKSPKEVEVCKLKHYQCPLKIMLDWCGKGGEYYGHNLETRKFVLQENDPGSIEWDEFCVPELKSFITILGQEEEEQKKQIIRKYDILRTEIHRRMTIKKNIRQQTDHVLL